VSPLPEPTVIADEWTGPSGSGRCNSRAPSGGAVIQVSTSSGVVRITGIALRWMTPTSAFGSVVRNANILVVSPSLTFRTDVQLVRMPAKQARPGQADRRAARCSRGTRFADPSTVLRFY
jgi:hypothetical protein